MAGRPEEQVQVMATLCRKTALLTSLVADVQASAAAEQHDFAVAPRLVPVAALLAEAAAVARTLLGNHPLTVPPAPPVLVRADPERIGQVLRNLLSNAAKYAPPGTAIELRAQPAGERVQITVADRGPGIHPDDLPRIFEKFGRGRDVDGRRVPGVGLGLYLSRRLLQAHGTDLTVESAPGQGAAFGFPLEVVA